MKKILITFLGFLMLATPSFVVAGNPKNLEQENIALISTCIAYENNRIQASELSSDDVLL